MKTRIALFALLLPLAAFGSDHYLATLTSSGSSVSYTGRPGAHLALQCDAPVFYEVGVGSATADATEGFRIEANTLFDVHFAGREDTVAIIPVSGSVSCKVGAVSP